MISIWNPAHSKTGQKSVIQKPDLSGFRFHTKLYFICPEVLTGFLFFAGKVRWRGKKFWTFFSKWDYVETDLYKRQVWTKNSVIFVDLSNFFKRPAYCFQFIRFLLLILISETYKEKHVKSLLQSSLS